MNFLKNFTTKAQGKITLVTHDGSFHTDDVFACALLSLMLEKKSDRYEVIRTRDMKIINEGDYVFDVGEIYNKDKNRFDHHQKGGAGKRLVGTTEIEYASFGLVWKKFGAEFCGSQKAADIIEKKLVAPVDAWDNGYELVQNKFPDVSPYFMQHMFFSLEPTWREKSLKIDKIFIKAVGMAKEILSREIIQAQDSIIAEEAVMKIYREAKDKKILVFDENYPSQYILSAFPEPLFIVYPRKTNGWWGAKAVRNDPKSFVNRKDFPKAWGGMREEDLQKLTRVEDAVFCHKGLYMAVAKTKDGAIALAQQALGE